MNFTHLPWSVVLVMVEAVYLKDACVGPPSPPPFQPHPDPPVPPLVILVTV